MKRLLPYILLIIFLTLCCGFGGYWWQVGRYIETTDNAYVRSDIIPISARVSGYVEAVLVADNQIVAAGESLVRVQDLEYRVRLERGRSGLAERKAALLVASGKRNQQSSKIDLAKAQLLVTEVELQRLTDEFKRFESLYAEKIISPLKFGEIQSERNKCQAEVAGAEANLKIVEQELAVQLAEEQRIEAEIAQHREELKLLQQDVDDTGISAPVAGTVGNRRVKVGQYVRPGSILLALIPLHRVWVEANFKEMQLARMQQGQMVEIKVDAFPGQSFTGRIQSFSPASGAEFSILPPENATGNFTKIVQRISVKISFDLDQLQNNKLLPGMSVEVRLDTRRSPESAERTAQLADK